MNPLIEIGNKIKKVRELKGFTLEDTAARLQMPSADYEGIETGSRDIYFSKLNEIAIALEVTVQDIINIPEQLNIHSVSNSQVGFHYNDYRKGSDKVKDLKDEIAYLRKQNEQLLDVIKAAKQSH
jgi:transcriptional regulator with XRE-family HTH domain